MQLAEMTWEAIGAIDRDTPVIVPIAACEQHGRHMPVFTDSMLLGEVVRRAHEQLANRVLVAPLMWLGNSEHHLDFPGTLTASPRTYLDLLCELMENLIFHRFRRIVLLNGHGGNIVPGSQATFEVRQRHRKRDDLLLLSATYWLLGSKPHELNPDIKQQRMGHACEWETSMMLKIAPQLVVDLDHVQAQEFGISFEPATRAWITKDRSQEGHIGDPRHATAEKGETLFSTFSADVVAFMERVIKWDGETWDA